MYRVSPGQKQLDTQSIDLPQLHTIEAPPRCSMDTKVNTWGNSLIDVCIAHNLCLLNGRTVGDLEGRCTYFGIGNSVIDVTIVDQDILSSTLAFKVHNLTEFSNHCKIETILACSPKKNVVPDPQIQILNFYKYIWNQDTSPVKLNLAIKSQEFQDLHQKIINNTYAINSAGTNDLTKDVEDLIKFLHDQSCDKIRIGRKPKHKSKKQPWFTPDCQTLRKRVRRAANFLSRNPFNERAREEYFSTNRQYRRLIKKSQKMNAENSLTKLIKSTDTHEMWKILSVMRGKKPGAPIPMAELYSHFNTVLNNTEKHPPEHILNTIKTKLPEYTENTPHVANPLSTGCYTPAHIIKLAKTLKNGKSAFLDGALNEVIKQSISNVASILCKLFNHIELSAEFPTPWQSSFLVPLHKKGYLGNPDNYRGLAVGSNIGKFYTKCLNEKFKKYTDDNNILSPHQFGFRDNFRTSDAIFTLRSIMSYYKNFNNKPVYACFVDFSKAFDSVNRAAMVYKLGTIGIRGNMLRLIKSMYNNPNYIIKSNGEYSIPLNSNIGVKQGCNLSPLLFNIFINDIHSIFDTKCKPVNINNWNINSLSFADDLVLLSETPIGLGNSLKKLETYCNDWGLKVNPTKTKVIAFNKPFTKKIKSMEFTIDGKAIQITNSYCYLGIEMTNTGSFQKSTDMLYKKSLRALFSIYSSLNVHSDETNTRLFLKLFDSLIMPVLLYGCEVWGSHVIKANNPISKFTNKFYRTLLGVPGHCSTVGTHVELGRFPIEINIHKTMLKYWFRLVTLPKNRLVSHCYWSLLEIADLKDPWFDTIQNIINTTGQYFIWNNQTLLAETETRTILKLQGHILNTLQDLSVQYSITKMENESKLYLFKNAKDSLCISRYLTTLNGKKRRSLFCKLRLGTTELEIEKGRKSGIPRHERFCKLCPLNTPEDEMHFITECPALTNCRINFMEKIIKLNQTFRHLNRLERIKYLYFNDNLPPNELTIAADMLVNLESTRESLLTVGSLN